MPYNILLVDDSKTIRSILTKTLFLTGLEIDHVFEAGNGKEALNVLLENWIDLVLTDINMPEMNGIELVEAMSKDGLLKSIPVIIISTDGSATRMRQLKSLGVKEYLRKPFAPESLKDVIDRVLEVKYA